MNQIITLFKNLLAFCNFIETVLKDMFEIGLQVTAGERERKVGKARWER
jgi:hypothetical protein